MISQRTFGSTHALEGAAIDLLVRHMTLADPSPHAVMLTGGRTPLGIYDRIARMAVHADSGLHLLMSDERHVPVGSPESNFGKVRPMIEALGVHESRLLCVHTDLALEEAASRYDADLRAFLDSGGRVTLGLLGLGADGHVCSLFDPSDVLRGAGRLAIPVRRQDGPDRISTTRDFLLEIDALVFIVTGEEKRDAVRKLLHHPESIPAGLAIRGAGDVSLWTAEH